MDFLPFDVIFNRKKKPKNYTEKLMKILNKSENLPAAYFYCFLYIITEQRN